MTISVLTPYLASDVDSPRVAAELGAWLAALRPQAGPLEVILAGAAPTRRDPWRPLLERLDPTFPHSLRTLHAPWNRGLAPPATRAAATNAAAAAACGEVLCILHADCRLPADAARIIREAWAAGYRTGAFPKRYEPAPLLLRIQELWLNGWRLGRLGHSVGTNAVWVDAGWWRGREHPDWPFLEDHDLSDRLRAGVGAGGVHVARAPVVVSPAKYLRTGLLASLAINAAVLGLWRVGRVPPGVLRDELYSRDRLAVGTARFWPSFARGLQRSWRRRGERPPSRLPSGFEAVGRGRWA